MEQKEIDNLNKEIRKISEENKLKYSHVKELIKGSEFDNRIIEMIEEEEYDELEEKIKTFLEERKLEYEGIKRNIEEEEIKRIVEKTGLRYEVVEKMLNFDVQFHGGYTNKEIKVIKIEKDGRNILKMIITEKK